MGVCMAGTEGRIGSGTMWEPFTSYKAEPRQSSIKKRSFSIYFLFPAHTSLLSPWLAFPPLFSIMDHNIGFTTDGSTPQRCAACFAYTLSHRGPPRIGTTQAAVAASRG